MTSIPEFKEEDIATAELLSPSEHWFALSTPEPGDWPPDIPIAITKGVPAKMVAQLRVQKLAGYHPTIAGYALGYNRPLVIQFSEIDSRTGKVLEEPRFIGFWNEEAGKVEPARDPESFDQEVKAKLAEVMKNTTGEH